MKRALLLVMALGCAGEPFHGAELEQLGGAGAGASSLGGSASSPSLGGSAEAGNKSARGGSPTAGAPSSSGGAAAGNGDKSAGAGGELLGGATAAGAGGEGRELEPGPCDRQAWRLTAFGAAEGEPPAAALDGNPGTRWASGEERKPGQWVQLDLGGLVELDALELRGGASDVPRQVALELDGVLVMAASSSSGDALALTFERRLVSTVRLELVAGSVYWWGISELTGTCAR